MRPSRRNAPLGAVEAALLYASTATSVPIYRPEAYGAVGDVRQINGASVGAGSFALTKSGGTFSAADIGKTVVVPGAGTSGAALVTTVASVQSNSSCTLTDSATTAVISGFAWLGTDSTAGLQQWLNAIPSGGRGETLPGSTYLATSGLTCTTPNIELKMSGGSAQHVDVSAAPSKILVAGPGTIGLTLGTTTTTRYGGPTLRDFHLYCADASSAGGLLILRMNNWVLDNVSATAFTNGYGIHSDGTGNVNQYGQILNPSCNNNQVGIKFTSSNGVRVFGGMLDGNNNGGSPPGTGSTGVQVVSGDNNRLFGTVIQFYDIGVDIQLGQAHELFGVRVEGCTLGVKFNGAYGAMHGGMVNNYIAGGGGTGVQITATATNTHLNYPLLTGVATKVDNGSVTTIRKSDNSELTTTAEFRNGLTVGQTAFDSILWLGGDLTVGLSRVRPRMLVAGRNVTDDLSTVIAAGHSTAIVTKTADYTLTQQDSTVLCNGTLTLTLPNPVDGLFYTGRMFRVRNVGTGTVTVVVNPSIPSGGTPVGTDIDGGASITIAPGAKATLQTDLTAWWTV